MALYEPLIPQRYMAPLWKIVASQGPELRDDIRRSVGLDDFDGVLLLPITKFDQLLAMTANSLQRDDLGFDMGKAIGFGDHDALSLSMQYCATINEILVLLTRYFHLITTAFSVSYLRDCEHVEWCVRPISGMSSLTLCAMQEVFAVSFHTVFASLLPTTRGPDVYLSMGEPAHVHRYKQLGSSRFFFQATTLPEVRFVLPVETADAPFKKARSVTGVTEQGSITTADSSPQRKAGYGDWAAMMLREADGIQPSRKMLADILNISTRTLSRKLADEGVDFRLMANEIRQSRARDLLADGRWPITEVAYRLGYADISSFTRAFRKTTGQSPRKFKGSG